MTFRIESETKTPVNEYNQANDLLCFLLENRPDLGESKRELKSRVDRLFVEFQIESNVYTNVELAGALDRASESSENDSDLNIHVINYLDTLDAERVKSQF